MRKPKEHIPALSDNAVDKMMACLNYRVVRHFPKNVDYVKAPSYFDACWQWYRLLPSDDRQMVSLVRDVWAFPDRRPLAEMIAAQLPPAPEYPAVLAYHH
jgi:hypothetical protein